MMKALPIYLVMILLLAVSACNDEKVVDETSLPPQATEFIEAHFPDVKIRRVVRDRDDLLKSYEVILDNQVELEFDRQGECYSVDAPGNEQIPNSVVPLKVLEYVQANYSGEVITEWEKGKNTQEIKLSNRKELIFNLSGGFLRIDD